MLFVQNIGSIVDFCPWEYLNVFEADQYNNLEFGGVKYEKFIVNLWYYEHDCLRFVLVICCIKSVWVLSCV